MTSFSCFSPAHTSSERRRQPSQGLLAAMVASLSHLAAKLKPHRAMKMVRRRNGAAEMKQAEREEAVWRRAILMGDKCQPLDFSGVIYYDESGRQITELPPRSPRSPLLLSPMRPYKLDNDVVRGIKK